MGMRTVNDPYGDPSGLVDTVFRTSYNAVWNVANNIDYVKKVANLFDTSETIVSNVHQRYVSAEGQSEFELPVSVVSETLVTVFVNGKWKSPSTTFTAYGTTLFFNQALNEGDVVDAMVVSGETFDVLQKLKEDAEQNSTIAIAQRVLAEQAADTATTAANTAIDIRATLRKNAFDATRAPLPTDDASQGYEVGSRWLWQGQEWIAVSVTTGQARWAPVSRVTPQLFGATGGGAIDDSPAVQAWLTFIILNNIEGYVPAGDYLLNTAVSVAFSNKRFSIIGCGIGASRFIVTSAGGGLLMDATDRRSQFTGKDFSVIARGISRGTGLRFTLVPGGNQHQRSVILDNVETKGEGIAADCFDKFIDLTGNWRPLIRSCVVGGPFGTGASDNLTDASPMFVATAGLVIDHCYDPSIENCHIWSVRVGISARGTDQEALRLTNSVINGVRVALDYYRTTREPIVWIDNCHINFRDDGLKIDGARLVIIRGSHPYNEDGGQNYSGVPHDIWLKNTERVIIANNIFHFDGNPDRINVFFDATVFAQGLIVTGNIFGALAAEAVRLGAGARSIHVGDNHFPGTIGIKVNDLSSTAVITGQTVAGEYTVENQADNNASGPNLNLYRNSDSPEVGDALASLKMRGNDSAGNVTDYVTARGVVSSPVDGNESAEWQFFALIAGALSRQLTVGNGVQIGAPNGGARGAGSLNVEGLIRATKLELFSYDDGSMVGPSAVSTRDSLTPAANDALGAEIYRGRNSAAALIDYALHRVMISSPTAGSEAGEHQFFSRLAGALNKQLTVGNGVQVGSPTGGGKGPGTLNVEGGVFVNNVAGATGTFTSQNGKTVTVSNGIITGIV